MHQSRLKVSGGEIDDDWRDRNDKAAYRISFFQVAGRCLKRQQSTLMAWNGHNPSGANHKNRMDLIYLRGKALVRNPGQQYVLRPGDGGAFAMPSTAVKPRQKPVAGRNGQGRKPRPQHDHRPEIMTGRVRGRLYLAE